MEYKRFIKTGLNLMDPNLSQESQDKTIVVDKQLNSNYLTKFLNDRV